MSIIVAVTVILPRSSDHARLESLIAEHRGWRPEPAESCGGKVVKDTYVFGFNGPPVELLDALMEGPWADGSVVYIDHEMNARPQVKIFGQPPDGNWSDDPPPYDWR